MFRIKSFSNAEEFNRIFGKTVHGNGVVSRKNAILLALLKSKTIWSWCKKHDDWRMLNLSSMQDMKQLVLNYILFFVRKKFTVLSKYCKIPLNIDLEI